MANVYAVKSGNWSDTTLWNTSALPATVDDVYANTFTVYVDNNYQVTSVRNLSTAGITQGGFFVLNNSVTLSATVVGGGTFNQGAVHFLSAAPSFATIVGNITANGLITQTTNSIAIIHNGTGTLTVYGSAIGASNVGSVSNGYIRNTSSGTFNIIGDVIGGGTGAGFYGINNTSTGTINVTGNVTGTNAAISTNYGIVNSSSGTVNILGNVTSGTIAGSSLGVLNNSIGTINVIGNITSRGSTGASNNSTGFFNVTGNITGSQIVANQIGLINTGTCFVSGNVIGGPEAAGGAGGNSYGIQHSSADVLTVYGNVSGAGAVTATGFGLINTSLGRVIIFGNVHGRVAEGARNNATGTIIVNGNVYGGPGASIHGMQNSSSATGSIIVNGNAVGGTGSGAVGIVNNIGGRVIVNGNAIANTGSLSYGVAQNGAGYVEINGFAIGNDWGLGSSGIGGAAPGVIGSQIGTTIVRGLSCGQRGQWPTAGNVFIIPQSTSTVTLYTSALSAGPSTVLFTSLSTNIVPPASSVRLGTKYNLNDYTGTCNMPSISSVLQGVSVDNSVGIAALQPQTIWNYSTLSATDVNSLGGRLANVATVQSIGQQLTALNL